jgi:hypothetical protein
MSAVGRISDCRSSLPETLQKYPPEDSEASLKARPLQRLTLLAF